jgi:hypothetical protein
MAPFDLVGAPISQAIDWRAYSGWSDPCKAFLDRLRDGGGTIMRGALFRFC